jgi:hypothetical protein
MWTGGSCAVFPGSTLTPAKFTGNGDAGALTLTSYLPGASAILYVPVCLSASTVLTVFPDWLTMTRAPELGGTTAPSTAPSCFVWHEDIRMMLHIKKRIL